MSVAFTYRAKTPLGKIVEGSIRGESEGDVSAQLRREGLLPLEVHAEDDEEEDEGISFFRSVRRSELIYATNQLAILTDAGISLAPALAAAIEEERNPLLKSILEDVKSRVEGGEDLSVALARHEEVFDQVYVALVRAGEKTGALGEMLVRVAASLQAEHETRGKIRAAMIYPCVMLVVALAVTIFLLTFVLPKFVPVFESRRMELPTITKAVLRASDTVTRNYPYLLGGVFSLAGAWWILKQTEGGRKWLDRVKLSLPVIGPIYRKIILCRCVRILGTMLGAGVPLLEAVELTGDTAGNSLHKAAWDEVNRDLVEGKSLGEALRRQSIFPRILVQMVAAGEATGKLDHVLAKTATFYERELETAVKTAVSLIEPAMIIVMGGVVGTIGLALLLPIFSLSRPG